MKAPWSRPRKSGQPDSDDGVADRALLISIQPRFANAILNGTKTIELRRTMPTLPPAALALIYASSPTKAVLGWATVDEVLRASPSALWRNHKDSTGVNVDEFTDYFAGRSAAFGLQLSAVRRADDALSLSALRAHGLEPPQSWRYIATDLAQALRCQMTEAVPVLGQGPQLVAAAR